VIYPWAIARLIARDILGPETPSESAIDLSVE
jgi:hypothetical protein